MRINLICSDNLRGILTELLSARGIAIDDGSDMVIVESGYELPKGKLAVVFDMLNMARLIELFDKLSRTSEENIGTIVGRNEDKYEVIPITQVYFFEGKGNNTFCITMGGEYRVKEKLYEFEYRYILYFYNLLLLQLLKLISQSCRIQEG